MSAERFITERLSLWTTAITAKSNSGRGNDEKIELTGINKLRELILELAVRGKLVPQNPEDEPASALLKRVAEEQQKLAVSGHIRRRKKINETSSHHLEFDLPEGWQIAQIRSICRDWGQKTPDKEFTYLDVASIDNTKGRIKQPSTLLPANAPSRARKKVQKGTVIYSTVRPYLQNIAVIEDQIRPEPIASTAFAIVHPLGTMPSRFFLHYLRSPTFVTYVESVQTGIAYPAINDRQFFSAEIPVPPLAEQHRIVQKVDELMALCDRLEQQTRDQHAAHEALVDALLDTLTLSKDADELADNWTRLAAHFDTLFTTEHSIERLEQAILELGVKGRLVRQNSDDEPASILLEKISHKKALLTQGKRAHKTRIPEEPLEPNEPFEIPRGWVWTALKNVGSTTTGKTPSTKNKTFFGGQIPFIGPGQIASSGIIVAPDKYLSEEGIKESEEATPDDLLMVCIGGSIGKTAKATERCGFNQQINKIRPIIANADYLLAVLNTDFFLGRVAVSHG